MPFNDYHIGVTAENPAREYGISRELQDAYALSSKQPWPRLIPDVLKMRLSLIVTQRTGQTAYSSIRDEQPRADASAEGLALLHPAFDSQVR